MPCRHAGQLLEIPTDQLSSEQLFQLLKRLRNRLACLVDRCRKHAALPPRSGPRWEGEHEAAALLEAAAEAETAAAAGLASEEGLPGGSR